MKGFLRDLEEVPVSTLREAFVRAVETLGFGEDIWKGMRKGIGNPIGEGAAYQDQDQHRQQQQGSETHTPTVPPASGNVASQHERFERFWTAYPKKVAKDAAWKAWRQRNPNQELTEEMLAAVEWQRTQDDWRRDGGRYIPKPATWLTDGRWQDQPRSTPRVSDRNLAIAGAVKEFAGHD
jgi:hypothetical protein